MFNQYFTIMDLKDRELVEVDLHGKKQKVFKGEIPMLEKIGKLIKERKEPVQTKEEKNKPETKEEKTSGPMTKEKNLKNVKSGN